METLIALAILSLTSLILFQSTSSMLSVSEKAAIASENLVENTIARETYKNIVGGLTPGWPERESTVFRGDSDGFSGLSTSFPSIIDYQLVEVDVSLNRALKKEYNLVIKMADSSEIVLEKFDVGSAEFEYMGHDQVFYPIWPPEKLKHRGFEIDKNFAKTPALPELIRLTLKDSTAGNDVIGIWTASVSGAVDLPYRDDLTANEYDL